MLKLKIEANVKRGRRNKRKGAERERLVKGQLEERGWCVVKAGASLGVFDLIGIHPDINICLLIQVKSNRLPARKERELILSFLVPTYCQKLIWTIKDRKLNEPQVFICDKHIFPVDHRLYLK